MHVHLGARLSLEQVVQFEGAGIYYAATFTEAGNTKRVASAVGEGSIAVSFVQGVLRE